MFTILIYITETASLLYLLDSKILCLLVFWHLLCLKKNKMYSVHGSHSFISFLSCSCTNVLSALAYTHPQLDIKVVNTHFLITQLQATVGPKGPSSRPTSHPHYTPNHLNSPDYPKVWYLSTMHIRIPSSLGTKFDQFFLDFGFVLTTGKWQEVK